MHLSNFTRPSLRERIKLTNLFIKKQIFIRLCEVLAAYYSFETFEILNRFRISATDSHRWTQIDLNIKEINNLSSYNKRKYQ